MKKNELKRERLFFLEVALFLFFFFMSLTFYNVMGGVGEDNVTILSELEVGISAPIITSIDLGGDINLIPNATKLVNCSIEIVDYEGEGDIENVSAVLFHNSLSSYGNTDDNNLHYTNSSCVINSGYGDEYTVLSNCFFLVQYYANPGTWNCTAKVNDSHDFVEMNSTTDDVQELLAIGLPDSINYGTVNATYVSAENITNITNYGNVKINLSLMGYAQTIGDEYSMNCSLGSIGKIPIYYEKYNLSQTTAGQLTLSQFEASYLNLTNSSVVKRFELNFRQNDTVNKAINATYWRIYVPEGVGGTCQGNIVFGATQSAGS